MNVPKLSRQAKSIATAVAILLVQVQVYVGLGGIEALQAVTFGQWISVVVNTLASYGAVYSIPNADPAGKHAAEDA